MQAAAQQGALTVQVDLVRIVDESENVVLARVTNVVAEKHPQYDTTFPNGAANRQNYLRMTFGAVFRFGG
jgi:hypothetical protein